jgi:beta-glucanase (GH16 family)
MDAAIPDAGQVSVNSGILHLKGEWLPNVQTRTTSATGVNVLTHKTGYLDQRKIQSTNVSRGQRWGRWEIRAKTPTGANTMGALAAFWLRNANSGEIDIMEAWGYGTAMPTAGKVMQDNAATTIHTKTDGTGVKRLWRHKELGSTSAPHDGFHVYAFELMPTYAAMYVDGKRIMRTTPAEYPDLWNTTYFGTPLHMRLNLHVGPDPRYWGIPDPLKRWLTGPLDYQVDYVRTWNAPS